MFFLLNSLTKPVYSTPPIIMPCRCVTCDCPISPIGLRLKAEQQGFHTSFEDSHRGLSPQKCCYTDTGIFMK